MASGEPPLDEAKLDSLLAEAKEAHAQHGAGSEEADGAKAVCESELDRWQRAVEEDDGSGVERLFGTIVRVRCDLDALGQSPPAPPSGPDSAPSDVDEAAAAPPPPPPDRAKAGKKKAKKSREQLAQAPADVGGLAAWPEDVGGASAPWGAAPAAAFDAFGGPPDLGALGGFPTSSPESSVFGAAADFPPVSDPFGAGADTGGFTPNTFGDGVAGAFGDPPGDPFASSARPFGDGSPQPAPSVPPPPVLVASVPTPPLAPVSAPGSHGGSLAASGADAAKDEEIESLRAELSEAKEARRKLRRELESLQRQVTDSRGGDHPSALRLIEEEAQGLREELARVRAELSSQAEQLSEQEGQLSDIRERLFKEKKRGSQLESELMSGEAARLQLQDLLRDERAARGAAERESERLRLAIGEGHRALLTGAGRPAEGADAEGRSGSVGYAARAPSAPAGGASRSAVGRAWRSPPLMVDSGSPKVSRQDELSSTQPPSGLTPSRSSSRPSDATVAARAAGAKVSLQLPRASADDWRRAPRARCQPGALLSRSPPAPRGCAEQVAANFRRLLSQSRGVLYEDEHLTIEFSTSPASSGLEPSGAYRCAFELAGSARGRRQGPGVQEVRMAPAADVLQQLPSVRLRIDPGKGADRRVFSGEMEVLSPYEICPQVDLSYLLPDGLSCRARFRLPLPAARLLEQAPNISASQFKSLWCSPDFAQAEVCCVCSARPAFLAPGGLYFYAKGLELSGLLASLPGLDSSPHSVALAGLYRPFSGRAAGGVFPGPELLVRAELGGPAGEGALCRLAVRSGSHALNRSVMEVLLDSLCEPA